MSAKRKVSLPFKWIIGVIILLFFLITGIAGALTVDIDPETVPPGGDILVTVTGVPNEVPLTISFQAQFPVTPGQEFSFEIHDLVVPLNLTNRSLFLRMENTAYNRITFHEFDPGHPDINNSFVIDGPSVAGNFERELTFADPTHPDESSEIRDIYLAGNATGTTQYIVATYQIRAVKASGATDFQMPFRISGIDAAIVKVSVDLNNQAVFSDTVVVDSPDERAMTVMVQSIPSGASVTVDGVYVGQTTLYTDVFSGVRTLIIEKPGYYPVTKHVSVGYNPGHVIIVSAELIPKPIYPSVQSPGFLSPAVLVPAQPYIPMLVYGGSSGNTAGPGLADPVPIIPAPAVYASNGFTVDPNTILVRSVPVPFF